MPLPSRLDQIFGKRIDRYWNMQAIEDLKDVFAGRFKYYKLSGLVKQDRFVIFV